MIGIGNGLNSSVICPHEIWKGVSDSLQVVAGSQWGHGGLPCFQLILDVQSGVRSSGSPDTPKTMIICIAGTWWIRDTLRTSTRICRTKPCPTTQRAT